MNDKERLEKFKSIFIPLNRERGELMSKANRLMEEIIMAEDNSLEEELDNVIQRLKEIQHEAEELLTK